MLPFWNMPSKLLWPVPAAGSGGADAAVAGAGDGDWAAAAKGSAWAGEGDAGGASGLDSRALPTHHVLATCLPP